MLTTLRSRLGDVVLGSDFLRRLYAWVAIGANRVARMTRLVVAVSWAVSGCTVVDTRGGGGRHYGQNKAPGAPGLYKVAAKSSALTESPPPSPDSAWPNEPAGLTLLNNQPWDALGTDQNWINNWGYHPQNGYADIVTDGTAPRSPSNVLRIVFPPTIPGDHQPASIYTAFGNNAEHELYTASWMKLASNWDTHGTKLMDIWFSNGDIFIVHLTDGDDTSRHINMCVMTALYGYDRPPAGPEGAWPSNVATTPIIAGQWYLVEVYAKFPTTPGGSDGIIRWWVNGLLQGDYTNMVYPAEAWGFFTVEYPFTRQVAPAQESYAYIDHTYISGRR
jgi:hypothetical protein